MMCLVCSTIVSLVVSQTYKYPTKCTLHLFPSQDLTDLHHNQSLSRAVRIQFNGRFIHHSSFNKLDAMFDVSAARHDSLP